MTTDLAKGLAVLGDARPDYDRAHRYYEGDIPEVLDHFHPAIRRAVRLTGAAYRFRLARKPVSLLSNRVGVSSVTVPADDATTQVLDDIRKANGLTGVWENALITRTFEYGDAYLCVWPADDTSDDAVRKVGVEVTYHSPVNVRMVYDLETNRVPQFVIKQWLTKTPDGQDMTRVDLYYRDRIERYARLGREASTPAANVTGPQSSGADAGFTPWNGDDQGLDAAEERGDTRWPAGTLENPYDTLPFFHFRTDMPYGRPVHADAYGPQDAINKLTITHLSAVDTMGWPQRVALLDPAAVLNENNDDPDWDDDADAQAVNGLPGLPGRQRRGGQSSSMRSGPGIIEYLSGMKDVKQFDAAESANFIEPIPTYLRLMSMATDMPLYELDPAVTPPSGRALKVANAPLDAKQEHLEALLDTPFVQAYEFALKVVGKTAEVEVEFKPAPRTEDPEDWQVAKEQEDRGVPQAQILRERGYTNDQLDEWLASDAETDLSHRLDMVVKLGQALGGQGGGFSAAIQAGLLDAAQAAAIVAQLLTMAAGDEGKLTLPVPVPISDEVPEGGPSDTRTGDSDPADDPGRFGYSGS